MADVQHKRGTRAALDVLAGAGSLKAGQVYLLTDEERIAVALSGSAYRAFAKQSEAASGGRIVKAADEARASNVNLTADAELKVQVAAGKCRVLIDAVLTAASSSSGMKYDVSFGGTATAFHVRKHRPTGSATEVIATGNGLPSSSAAFSSATGLASIQLDVSLDVTAAGELAFRWAQNTSNSSALTVKAGSRLELLPA